MDAFDARGVKGPPKPCLLLLDTGADVNAVSEQHGYTSLALAAQKGYVQIVETLLAVGAVPQVPAAFFDGSLLKYVKTGPGRDNTQILELLIQAARKITEKSFNTLRQPPSRFLHRQPLQLLLNRLHQRPQRLLRKIKHNPRRRK